MQNAKGVQRNMQMQVIRRMQRDAKDAQDLSSRNVGSARQLPQTISLMHKLEKNVSVVKLSHSPKGWTGGKGATHAHAQN